MLLTYTILYYTISYMDILKVIILFAGHPALTIAKNYISALINFLHNYTILGYING